jgi:hypothetical protein
MLKYLIIFHQILKILVAILRDIKNFKIFCDYTHSTIWKNIISNDVCGRLFNFNFYFHFYLISNSNYYSMLHITFYSIVEMYHMTILILLIRIIITGWLVSLLLQCVKMLCLLYSWCIKGDIWFVYFYVIPGYFNILLDGFDPCEDLLNVNTNSVQFISIQFNRKSMK